MIVKEIKKQGNVFDDTNDVKQGVRRSVKKLRNQPGIDLSFIRSSEYLDYIASQIRHIDIEEETIQTAENYCRNVETTSGVARSKVAIAGTCLKKAVEENHEGQELTPAQLEEITGMKDVTFRNNTRFFNNKDLFQE